MMIVVPVTQQHIDEGECADPRTCAFALALNDATHERWSVVQPRFRNIKYDTDYLPSLYLNEYTMDDELQTWIANFDSADSTIVVRPLVFTFDPDDVTVIATRYKGAETTT